MNWRIEKKKRDWYCITPQGWSVCCGTWEDARNHFLDWSAQWAETEREHCGCPAVDPCTTHCRFPLAERRLGSA
jgi:hypothetical protein